VCVGVGCGRATAIRTDSGTFLSDEGMNPSLLSNEKIITSAF